jgi:protein-S-isoprenylcysteine O-methyltransferase Ste14
LELSRINDFKTLAELGITATIWICWCVIHSLLNSEGVIWNTLVKANCLEPYYRLLYNFVSVITLVLASWFTPHGRDALLWTWDGPLVPLQAALWGVALMVGYLSLRFMSLWDFLGLAALGIQRDHTVSQDGLVTWGIYGETRNPMFLVGLLLLWARDLTQTDMVINVILSVYLLIGAGIEEKRLLTKFGDEYARYMAQVPRFIPRRFPLNPSTEEL